MKNLTRPAIPDRSDGGSTGVAHHPRISKWAVFDPPLRERSAPADTVRRVYCRACRVLLGVTDDPVDAMLIALRHRADLLRKGMRDKRVKRRESPSIVQGHLGQPAA